MYAFASQAALAAPLGDGGGADVAPVDLVDPTIGTGVGSCMPGPCLPHASIYPSPDTLAPKPSGYNRKEHIVGFSQLHTQGTGGIASYGQFLLSPQIGLQVREADHASAKEGEVAKAYRYDVRLSRYGIDCAVVPSYHSALYKFTFPASEDANILLDVARKVGGGTALRNGSIVIDPEKATMSGGGDFDGNWVPGLHKIYFHAQFSRKPARSGVTVGDAIKAGVSQASSDGKPLGGYFGFQTTKDESISVRIAVSFKSVDQARKWLEEEIPSWEMKPLDDQARAAWVEKLGAIEVQGASSAEQRKFYTALWHSFVQPRDRTGDHWDTSEPYWDDHYTLWDSWKTLFPLLNIIDPQTSRGVVNSFIARHKHNTDGYVAPAFVAGVEYRTGQGGDEVDNVIADAFVKKVPGVDWQAAYALLKHHADVSGRMESYRRLGYVPEGETAPYCHRMKSGSGTLGFAINDFSVSEVAAGLGETADAERYRKRAENWKNVWDQKAGDTGYTGFPRSRKSDSEFTAAGLRKNYNVDFYEATSWEMAYAPTFAMDELISTMGGREKFVERLEFAFRSGLIDFSNEPSFMTPWLFAAAGRPDLSSYWADVFKKRYKADELPGDDDQGAMSSMYLFLVSGFFPIAGQDIYYLHGPSVPKTTWRLPDGKKLVISAENVGPRNIYIQSASLNGTPLRSARIRHSDIAKGGRLDFVMGDSPGKWGQE
ncbi:alpha-1,2-mannosidase [Terrimicrobium sacchariphilum]|uniref:Alpha-1,2-mannosidase n=1 Tax=Terrimicrobium sacchariphilum TaxID=690879 RepID=A0A146G1D3_TERSA|nr:GH92 family glycosyl hydrolase [Terrimicrobium sacchariphilum]GAT31470.1 alpha-1,2-mannosidase [Terrimicrobium sacchariphilum]